MKKGDSVRLSRWLAVFLATALCFLCVPGAVSGAETTVVSIGAPNEPVGAGEQISIEIEVTPGGPIAGMQFDLSFDASLFSVAMVQEGDLLRQGGATSFFNPGTVDNQAGRITGVFGAITGPGMTVSAPEAFAVVTLNAKRQTGNCPVSLSNVIVGDIDGNAVPVTLDSQASLAVTGGRPSFRWWVLSVIIGAAVVLIGVTIAGVLLRRRRMLRDLEAV